MFRSDVVFATRWAQILYRERSSQMGSHPLLARFRPHAVGMGLDIWVMADQIAALVDFKRTVNPQALAEPSAELESPPSA